MLKIEALIGARLAHWRVQQATPDRFADGSHEPALCSARRLNLLQKATLDWD